MKSLYEILYGAKVAKQRVVEEFTGDSLDERWTGFNTAGSGSEAILDSINGGVAITAPATNSASRILAFNGIRQYDFNSSVVISIWKYDNVSGAIAHGLMNETAGTPLTGTEDYIGVFVTTNPSDGLGSSDGATGSTVSMNNISSDTNWHWTKIHLQDTFAILVADGSFDAVKTTNLPTVKLQPFLESRRFTSGATVSNFRYYEVFNT